MTNNIIYKKYNHSELVQKYKEFKDEIRMWDEFEPTFQQFKDWKKKQYFIANVPDDKVFYVPEGSLIGIKHEEWKTKCLLETKTEIVIRAPIFRYVSMCTCCPDYTMTFNWGKGLIVDFGYEDVIIKDVDEVETPPTRLN